jgi:hypothetical protein
VAAAAAGGANGGGGGLPHPFGFNCVAKNLEAVLFNPVEGGPGVNFFWALSLGVPKEHVTSARELRR